MKKQTFKDFLMEVDVADLELARDFNNRTNAAAEDKTNRAKFGNEMKNSSPSPRNIIVDKAGKKFIVQKNDMKGIISKQVGGQSINVFPHGTKYKPLGKNDHGVVFFKEI